MFVVGYLSMFAVAPLLFTHGLLGLIDWRFHLRPLYTRQET